MNVLAPAFIEYLKDNIVLTVVLGIILLLIVALIIVMIVLAVKGKKTAQEEPAAEAAPAEEPASEPAKEEPAAEPAAEPAKEEPKEEPKKEEVKKEEVKKEESVKKTETKKEEAKKEEAKAAPAAAPAKEKGTGKWSVYKSGDKYAFDLVASNGEVMLTCGVPYATVTSAKSGITTYKNNIAKPESVQIEETKSGDYFVKILNARGGLLATSSNYKSKSNAESAAESIKRWAASAVIEISIVEE